MKKDKKVGIKIFEGTETYSVKIGLRKCSQKNSFPPLLADIAFYLTKHIENASAVLANIGIENIPAVVGSINGRMVLIFEKSQESNPNATCLMDCFFESNADALFLSGIGSLEAYLSDKPFIRRKINMEKYGVSKNSPVHPENPKHSKLEKASIAKKDAKKGGK